MFQSRNNSCRKQNVLHEPYGDDALNQMKTYEPFKHFKNNGRLGMHRVSAKFVPRLFNDYLLQSANENKYLLKNIITSNETWVYNYDTETKQQSSHWKSPVSLIPKKTPQVQSRMEAMLLPFLNHCTL
jgi:hypothetical protein